MIICVEKDIDDLKLMFDQQNQTTDQEKLAYLQTKIILDLYEKNAKLESDNI